MPTFGSSTPEIRNYFGTGAGLVSGIGFIGPGVIIFHNNRGRGRDTAASLWAVAGIGLAAGGGLFLAAGLGALFVVLGVARFSLERQRRG